MKKSSKSNKSCPVTTVAELLSDSWTMLILHRLLASPKKPTRFCELERALVGISTRTLTNKLKELEARNIVDRTEDGYTLTKLGTRISPVIKAMEKFGQEL